MIPSRRYIKVMKNKWKMSNKQLNLMMNEKCEKDEINIFSFNINDSK